MTVSGSSERSPVGAALSELVCTLEPLGVQLVGDAATWVTDLTQDSRHVTQGSLFVARRGGRVDGRRFIPAALEQGACAVLVEGEVTSLAAAEHAARGLGLSGRVPLLVVSDLGAALSPAAERVHQYPSRALDVVGITGTNGKTTTASVVAQVGQALGKTVAQLGTLGFKCAGVSEGASLTTPEADVVSRYLARARTLGASAVAMEVSSHALAQHRVDGLAFRAAALTNLTQDHLDYHGTMEEYGRAKARLFLDLAPEVCVINIDDPFGHELATRVGSRAIRVGRSAGADVRLLEVHSPVLGNQKTSYRIAMLGRPLTLETELVGTHNADNWLTCLGLAHALGWSAEEVAAVAPRIAGAPGRLERVHGEGDDIQVYVDYAHTPDALQRALMALGGAERGALWCVFGCGGDRDTGKRPLMGSAASRNADRVIITSDNPRTEEPGAIISQIESGLVAGVSADVVADRHQAIERALLTASSGDVVLIAGKGHEDYQIVGTERRPFDDREVARKVLAERRARQGQV